MAKEKDNDETIQSNVVEWSDVMWIYQQSAPRTLKYC